MCASAVNSATLWL